MSESNEQDWVIPPPEPGTVAFAFRPGADVELSPAAIEALETLARELGEEDVVVVPCRLDRDDPPFGAARSRRSPVHRVEDTGQDGPEQLRPLRGRGREVDGSVVLLQFVRHARASFRKGRS